LRDRSEHEMGDLSTMRPLPLSQVFNVKVITYPDAQSFLRHTQAQLELNEAANSLMLGVSLRLVRFAQRIRTPPYLSTAEDENGLVLAAIMTPPRKLVVYGHQGDLDEGVRILAEDLLDRGWKVPGVRGPTEVARCVARSWADISGQRCELERQQRVYELREVKTPVPPRGRLRLATKADLELVTGWRYEFCKAVFGQADREEVRRAALRGVEDGDIYLWEDERPVCMATQRRPTTNGISVSLVYTPPERRRRGYATACVGELSRLLLASGWGYCALFAEVDNAAAIRVYQKIGYEPVCEYEEYAFLDGVQR
jgi:predicted GNAT family acetyltransferase